MRGLLLPLVALSAILLPPRSARAGVYRQSEMADPLPTRWMGNNTSNNSVSLRRAEFSSMTDRVFNNAMPKPDPAVRNEYLRELEGLEKKEDEKGLAPKECMDLSACYIRLGRYEKAITLLEKTLKELGKEEPYRFLLQANLAMAYWGNQLPSRAIQWQRESLESWPTHFPGWTWEQWLRYRHADRALRDLMQARAVSLEGGRPPTSDPRLDPLFPGVRFTGPGGKYVVGGLDPAVAEKMPADAEAVVVQLILWLPDEKELLWYYAEVLNAEGKTGEALAVMDKLIDKQLGLNFTASELRQHRRALLEAGVEPKTGEAKEERPVSTTPPTAAPAPLVDWRQLSVGFAAGALVAVVAGLQLQEWRRRRAVPRG